MIQISRLKTGYTLRKGLHAVSSSISVEMREGTLTMLMGPNGCGKSTLMQTLSGLIPPLGGDVLIHGKPIVDIGDKERAKLLSLVLTERISTSGLIVLDIVSIGRYPYVGLRGRLEEEDLKQVNVALKHCRLLGYEHRQYIELSDGEKQRVMIARALAQETPIILLDEPTAHLDFPSRVDVMRMLRTMAREMKKAILVSTHELDLALEYADDIWLMNRDGELESGTADELIARESFEHCFGYEYVNFEERRQKLNH